MTLPKALVLEPVESIQVSWERRLSGKIEILSAYSIDDAKKIFMDDLDIKAVAVTCRNRLLLPKVKELITYMTKHFGGPIIALSVLTQTRNDLLGAGATHACGKEEFVEKLLEVLQIK